ncbi:MAG: S1 domain-containing protein [Candidatus Methanofastidiosia archaeon]
MARKKSKLSSKIVLSVEDSMALPKEGQVIGRVKKLLGGDRLLVSFPNGNETIVRIPGKFRGHLLFRVNSYVLLRQLIPGDNKRLDVIYRYSWEESEYLKKNGFLEGEK